MWRSSILHDDEKNDKMKKCIFRHFADRIRPRMKILGLEHIFAVICVAVALKMDHSTESYWQKREII